MRIHEKGEIFSFMKKGLLKIIYLHGFNLVEHYEGNYKAERAVHTGVIRYAMQHELYFIA